MLKGHLFWHTLLNRGFHPVATDASCLSEICWQRQGDTATFQGERMEGEKKGLWRESLRFKALHKRSKSAVILNVVYPYTEEWVQRLGPLWDDRRTSNALLLSRSDEHFSKKEQRKGAGQGWKGRNEERLFLVPTGPLQTLVSVHECARLMLLKHE